MGSPWTKKAFFVDLILSELNTTRAFSQDVKVISSYAKDFNLARRPLRRIQFKWNGLNEILLGELSAFIRIAKNEGRSATWVFEILLAKIPSFHQREAKESKTEKLVSL